MSVERPAVQPLRSEVTFQYRQAPPRRKVAKSLASLEGKAAEEPATQETFEVQGAALFAGQPREVTIGRLRLRAHLAKSGGVQVDGCEHAYR